jgi:hypothetical protein
MAVGSYIDKNTGNRLPLAELWNGTAWAIQSPVNPAASQTSLTSVSCTAANRCVAVGGFTTGFELDHTLAESWNGSTWKIQTTADVSGASVELLYSVQCAKANACTAVGASQTGSVYQTLAERWNGTAWTIQTTPTPPGTVDGGAAVSCASLTSCTAVWQGSTPIAEAWNGTTWATQTVPIPTGSYAQFSGVACTAASACTAVGLNAIGVSNLTLAERWDGTSWTLQNTPTPAGAANEQPLGIDCTTATACAAVGYFDNATGQQLGLAEAWNGTTWTVQNTPTPPSATSVSLAGVSCNGPGACTSVGQYSTLTGQQPLAEAWNGTTWTLQKTPTPSGATSSALNGVSCALATACVAVGQSSAGGPPQSLAEAWNGTTWTVLNTPPPSGATTSALNGVACTAANACVAVGHYSTSAGAEFTLAETWNGTAWTIDTSANPSTSLNLLDDVSCTAANTCTAVGGANSHTLAEAWNGTTWTVQTTPGPVQTIGTSSVSCTTAVACTAVGNPTDAFFAQTWDGTTWTAQTLATPAGANYSDYLSTVSCSSPNTCSAVGFFFHDYITSPDFLGIGAFTGIVVPLAERYS